MNVRIALSTCETKLPHSVNVPQHTAKTVLEMLKEHTKELMALAQLTQLPRSLSNQASWGVNTC